MTQICTPHILDINFNSLTHYFIEWSCIFHKKVKTKSRWFNNIKNICFLALSELNDICRTKYILYIILFLAQFKVVWCSLLLRICSLFWAPYLKIYMLKSSRCLFELLDVGFCGRQAISSYVNSTGRGQQQNTMCHRFAETIHI